MSRTLRPAAFAAALLAGVSGLAPTIAWAREPAGQAPAPEAAAEPAPAAAHAGWSQTRTPMPFDVMRSVQALQDQVARGNDAAIRVQALLLRRFTQSFLQADPAVWQDERNKRAAVLFTLSGGPPDLLEGLQREGLLGPGYDAIAQGSLLYVRNDLDGAMMRLSAVDPLGIDPVLGAQISLVMGQIQQFKSPAGALDHLNRARLLAPGGLIEEAALRLEALLADGEGRHEEADRLARRYFDRYADSTYAGNFEARFAAIMTERARTDAGEAFAAMGDVIGGLAPTRQARLFLAVSRRSLVEGDLRFSQMAAARALTVPDLAAADRVRAQLYETGSSLAALGPTGARRQLDAIDRAQLHPEDALLLDAGYRVLAGIGAPDPAPVETALGDVPVLARAEAALSAAVGALEADKP